MQQITDLFKVRGAHVRGGCKKMQAKKWKGTPSTGQVRERR